MINKKASGILFPFLLFFCFTAMAALCPNCSREGFNGVRCIHSNCPLYLDLSEEYKGEHEGVVLDNLPTIIFDATTFGGPNPAGIYLQQMGLSQWQPERKAVKNPEPANKPPQWISYVYYYTPKTEDEKEPECTVPLLDGELERAQNSEIGYTELQPSEGQDPLAFLQQHLNLFNQQYLLFYQIDNLTQIYIIETGPNGTLHVFSNVLSLWHEID